MSLWFVLILKVQAALILNENIHTGIYQVLREVVFAYSKML